jgi:hypothetical protein
LRGFISLLLVCGAASAQSADIEEILKQAINLHQTGDTVGAIPAYERYLAQRPDSPLAL